MTSIIKWKVQQLLLHFARRVSSGLGALILERDILRCRMKMTS